MSDILVAAYGTLRKGYGNSRLIDTGSNWLGTGKTINKYQLKARGIPFVNKTPDTEIVIDLWKIDDDILKNVDRLEGYDPKRHDDSWYKRELIPIEVNNIKYDAWLYFNNSDGQLIESGDYKNYNK